MGHRKFPWWKKHHSIKAHYRGLSAKVRQRQSHRRYLIWARAMLMANAQEPFPYDVHYRWGQLPSFWPSAQMRIGTELHRRPRGPAATAFGQWSRRGYDFQPRLDRARRQRRDVLLGYRIRGAPTRRRLLPGEQQVDRVYI
nr:hypothetical protein [Cressdnaviricota sp.]